MPNTRKNVRDALKAILSHATTGFNAAFQALADGEVYDLDAYSPDRLVIDWAAGSKSFQFAFMGSADQVNYSQLNGPFFATIYTSSAQSLDGAFQKFHGAIMAHFDVYVHFKGDIRAQDAIEGDDSESLLDAIEDAACEVLSRPTNNWGAYDVFFDGRYSAIRDPITIFQDGWAARVAMQMIFQVDV